MNKKAISFMLAGTIGYLPTATIADTSSTTATVTTTTPTATIVTVDAQYHDDASYLQHIQPRYLSTMGSSDNLSSIVNGLRNGTSITLQTGTGTPSTPGTTTIVFTSPTKPMGYGNITHTLDLATRELAAAGITSPTPDQLHTALMGGTVINAAGQTTTLQGVLQLRSQGMGWGQIAHTLGVSPSPYSKASATQTRGTSSTAKNNGITTAAGTTHTPHVANNGSAKTGIVTASGNAASSHAAMEHAHSGIVTAGGGNASFAADAGHAEHGNITLASGGSANGGITSANPASGHGNAYGKSKN